MQVVILAAGKSSRFIPFTTVSHKSMIHVLGKPILYHTLVSVKNAGIQDVVIVVGENSTIAQEIGDGKELGLSIKYVTHVGAKGMGAALSDAQEYLQDTFFLLNAYHVDFEKFANDMIKLQKNSSVVLLAKKPQESTQFGVIEINAEKVLGVKEKPEKILDNYLQIIGIYLLSKEFLSTLQSTPLEHYHFEKALNDFSQKKYMTYFLTKEETVSLKYSWDLLTIKNYLFSKMKTQKNKGSVAQTAVLEGNVFVDEGAVVMDGAIIKGPCYIGKNAKVGNYAILRNGVDVEEAAVIGARMEMKNSLVLERATTHSGFIGDSIVGPLTKIAAYFCTSNVRLDRKPVESVIKEEKVSSGLRHLGVIIGENANIGSRVTTMPGVLIGTQVVVGPSTTVMKNIPEHTKYYTRFSDIVEKHD